MTAAPLRPPARLVMLAVLVALAALAVPASAFAAASANLTPAPYDFGTHNLGTRTDQTFTLTNTGDSDLHVSGVGTANNSGQFGIVADGVSDHCSGQTVAAGATCTFAAAFVPNNTGPGVKTADVVAYSDASNGTADSSVQGTVAAGVMSLTPASYDFGSHPLDPYAAQHFTETFTITNTGGSPLTVTGIATGGSPDFSISNNPCDTSIAVGATCTFDVDFVALPSDPLMPGSGGGVGPQSGTAIVYWSDGTTSHTDTSALSATVTDGPVATVSPASHDFGGHALGTRTDQTFTITNTGGSPLDVQSISDNGSDDFDAGTAGSDNCSGQTVAAGGSCTFVWSFTPVTGTGSKSTSLYIYSNDPSAPTLVPISGDALNPSSISETPDPLDFGTVQTGDSAVQTVTVSNIGDVPMAVGQATLGFTNADQYAIVAGQDTCSGQIVAGGNSCTIAVRYSPTADGDAFAVLSVPSDATAGNGDVDVIGMAQTPAAPPTPTVTSPANGSTTADPTPDVVVSSEPGMSVHLLVDQNDDEGYKTAGADGKATFTLASPLPDGQHQLVVFARTDPYTASAERSSTFTVDTKAPASPAVTGGPLGTTSERTATFVFSGEAGATFACSLDGAAFTPCTSPVTYQGLGDGQHTFQVRQTDAAGHVGATSTQTFTVQGAGQAPVPAKDATALGLVVARIGTVAHNHVPVGCRLDAGQLATCSVTAYAGLKPVATGSAVFTGGRLGTVNVKLGARGRRLVHRIGGVRLAYRGTTTTAAGKRLHATAHSRVLPLVAASVPTHSMFATGRSGLNRYGRHYVRTLAAQLEGAKRVTCTGHSDSAGSAAMNKRLGLARAKTVCGALRRAGVRTRLVSRSAGESGLRASNRTALGRSLNRRVELAVRYR